MAFLKYWVSFACVFKTVPGIYDTQLVAIRVLQMKEDQLVLLLESLVELESLHTTTLYQLKSHFRLPTNNPDVSKTERMIWGRSNSFLT